MSYSLSGESLGRYFIAFKVEALNKHGNLNNYLDISAGSGTYAPRQRQVYASKRLQQVITDFRKRQKSSSLSPAPQSGSGETSQCDDSGSDNNQTPAAKKRKTMTTGDKIPVRTSSGRRKSSRTSKGKASDTDDEDGFVPPRDVVLAKPRLERKLRPRIKPQLMRTEMKDGQNEPRQDETSLCTENESEIGT